MLRALLKTGGFHVAQVGPWLDHLVNELAEQRANAQLEAAQPAQAQQQPAQLQVERANTPKRKAGTVTCSSLHEIQLL